MIDNWGMFKTIPLEFSREPFDPGSIDFDQVETAILDFLNTQGYPTQKATVSELNEDACCPITATSILIKGEPNKNSVLFYGGYTWDPETETAFFRMLSTEYIDQVVEMFVNENQGQAVSNGKSLIGPQDPVATDSPFRDFLLIEFNLDSNSASIRESDCCFRKASDLIINALDGLETEESRLDYVQSHFMDDEGSLFLYGIGTPALERIVGILDAADKIGSIKLLNFTFCGLDSFPEWALKFINIELFSFGCNRFREVPEAFPFSKLAHLNLYASLLKSLPPKWAEHTNTETFKTINFSLSLPEFIEFANT